MSNTYPNQKPTYLFAILSSFMVANALIAECIGTKIFSLEATLGLTPSSFTLFGQQGLSYALTCGVILWPLEFLITDIINEYYGGKAVRRISYTAIAIISYAFFAFVMASKTSPAQWWLSTGTKNGVPNMQQAFSAIFLQSSWIIVGSLVAFGIGQILDVYVFHLIKRKTGDKWLALRATGSTVVSQFVDSFIVLFIAFKIGAGWSWQQVLAIGLVNYSYKFLVALLLTPVLAISHKLIDNYLGKDVATSMKHHATL
jgi:queuosine precursor transporter